MNKGNLISACQDINVVRVKEALKSQEALWHDDIFCVNAFVFLYKELFRKHRFVDIVEIDRILFNESQKIWDDIDEGSVVTMITGSSVIEDLIPYLKKLDEAAVRDSEIKASQYLLHISAAHGYINIFNNIIEFGIDIGFKKIFQNASLILAAMFGQFDLVNFIVESGGNVNNSDETGCTPLMFASRSGHLNIVLHLLKVGAKFNKPNHMGITPLMYASMKDSLAVVECLVRFGGNRCIDEIDTDGNTALMYAVKHSRVNVVSFLVENKANCRISNSFNETPLSVSKEIGHESIVQCLNNSDNDHINNGEYAEGQSKNFTM